MIPRQFPACSETMTPLRHKRAHDRISVRDYCACAYQTIAVGSICWLSSHVVSGKNRETLSFRISLKTEHLRLDKMRTEKRTKSHTDGTRSSRFVTPFKVDHTVDHPRAVTCAIPGLVCKPSSVTLWLPKIFGLFRLPANGSDWRSSSAVVVAEAANATDNNGLGGEDVHEVCCTIALCTACRDGETPQRVPTHT